MKLLTILSICFAVAFVSSCSTTKSQDTNMPTDPETKAIKQTAELSNILKLTDDQYEKVKKINMDFISAIQKLKATTAAEGTDKRSPLQHLVEQKNAKMEEVLTDSQYTKYLRLNSERGSKARDGSGRKGGGGRS